MRLLTLKKRAATTVSDSQAASAQSTSRVVIRIDLDRCPATPGMDKSELATICQATPIRFADARKYRRGRSLPPPRRHSRSVAASSAATVMPCP